MARSLWAAVLFVGLAGCLDEELDRSAVRNRAIEVPNLPEASIAAAARVDQVGRLLIHHNPLIGVEPTFHTYGQQEPEIFHPDLNGVFITEGLVSRCKTDEELAAVLAMELASMSVEKRTARRLRDADPIGPIADSATVSPGGQSSDLNQLGTLAMIDRQMGQSRKGQAKRPVAADPRETAAEILSAAGIDPKALDSVEQLMREAAGHHSAAEGLGDRPTRPRWSN